MPDTKAGRCPGIPAYRITWKLQSATSHGFGAKALGKAPGGPYTSNPGALTYYEVLAVTLTTCRLHWSVTPQQHGLLDQWLAVWLYLLCITANRGCCLGVLSESRQRAVHWLEHAHLGVLQIVALPKLHKYFSTGRQAWYYVSGR